MLRRVLIGVGVLLLATVLIVVMVTRGSDDTGASSPSGNGGGNVVPFSDAPSETAPSIEPSAPVDETAAPVEEVTEEPAVDDAGREAATQAAAAYLGAYNNNASGKFAGRDDWLAEVEPLATGTHMAELREVGPPNSIVVQRTAQERGYTFVTNAACTPDTDGESRMSVDVTCGYTVDTIGPDGDVVPVEELGVWPFGGAEAYITLAVLLDGDTWRVNSTGVA